jgi:hypothetical protein
MMDGKVVITGDASSLISTMQQSAAAIRGFQTEATGNFDKLQSGIASMQSKWVALGSIILGGAGFKQAVDTSVNLNKEAVALGKALGIDATQASILNVALGDIYKTKDDLIGANNKMTQTLKKNEEAFTNLGVATRDQNGHFRNSLDIMLDVNTRLMQFKEGTDRNVEGTKIYGKQWSEISGMLKLTAGLMEESKKKAEALNLVVGEESIQSTAKYRAAMNDVEDVMTAVKKAIGDAVMPALTELGEEFSSSGPEKVDMMRKAIAVLVVGFYGLKNGAELVWTALKTGIQATVVGFLTQADVMNRALRGDFAGAKAAWQSGWDQIKDISKRGGEQIVADSVKNADAMNRAIERGFGPVKNTTAKTGTGSATSEGGDKKEKDDSRLRQWEAELDEFKLKEQEKAQAEGRFFQMSKEAEQKYRQDKKALVESGSKEETAVRKKLSELGLTIMKGQYEAEQENLKVQMEAAKNDYARREALAVKFSQNARDRFGAESKEYQEALRQQEVMRREHEDKMRAIDVIRADTQRRNSEAMIAEAQRVAQMDYDLGLITKTQLLEMQAGFIAENMRMDLALADYQIGLYKIGTVEYEQALQRRLEIKLKYDAQLSENKKSSTVEGAKPQTSIFGAAQSSMESAMTRMLTKTQTWAGAMRGIYKSVGTAFIQEMVSKPLAQWLAMWARKLAMNMGFLGTENAQQAAAAVTGTGIAIDSAGTKIGANAAVAGSGAASAVAGIPFIGPMLAIAAMAAIFSAVSGMRNNVKSAAGGFDIPKGMNPMVQTHAEEMILPAKYANGLRDMINGGSAGGADGPVHVHFHGMYQDASGLRKFLKDNGSLVADAAKAAHRNGWRP